MRTIYFDNNATTPLDPQVREAMAPYLNERFGNPSSGHRLGEQARNGVEKGREQVAQFINGDPTEVVFTGSGTESNNTAIWCAIAGAMGKRHIVSSVVEHPSILGPLQFLQDRFGYEVDLLPVGNDGALDLNRLADAIRPDTALVSLMGANNETGVLWDLHEIGRICRKEKVLLHSDVVQLAGKIPLDARSLPVDYLTIASHKLHGPKGCGALYIRRGAPVAPLLMGPGQENGRRAGTENVAGIAGFGQACELAQASILQTAPQIKALRDTLEDSISKKINGIRINGLGQPRLDNTSNISFQHCSSAMLTQELDEKGVAVSAHAACHSGDLDPSHVLSALAVPETFLHGTLRISLSRFNTSHETASFTSILETAVAKARQGLAL